MMFPGKAVKPCPFSFVHNFSCLRSQKVSGNFEAVDFMKDKLICVDLTIPEYEIIPVKSTPNNDLPASIS